MYQMKPERQYQPHVPVPICPTPVNQLSSQQAYVLAEALHGSPVNFLSPWGTQNLPSVDLIGMQAPQPPSNTFQCNRELHSSMEPYYMQAVTAALPSGGFLLSNGSKDLQWMTRTQTEHDKGATGLPQCSQRNNGRVLSQRTAEGAAGDLTAHQLRKPSSSLPQGVTGANAPSSHQAKQEVLNKRELRLMKNRKAASECRIRKKEYLLYLEERLAALETENAELKVRLQIFNTGPDV